METFPTSLLEREPRYKPECARILRMHGRVYTEDRENGCHRELARSSPEEITQRASNAANISGFNTWPPVEWPLIVAEAGWTKGFFVFFLR